MDSPTEDGMTAHQRGRPEGRRTLTVEEASVLLGVSRTSAYEAARAGQLPTIKLGRRLLVPRARLLALLGESDSEIG